MRGAGVMKVPKGKGKPGSLGRAAGGTARLQGCASKSEWSKVGEMIDNREELIDALTEASEIEHGLMIQYLYAAFTMKRELGEGLTTRQQMLRLRSPLADERHHALRSSDGGRHGKTTVIVRGDDPPGYYAPSQPPQQRRPFAPFGGLFRF